LQFRPQRWFDFVTWFDKERPPEANALASSVTQGAHLAERHGLSHDAASGVDATAERLLSGLGTSDLARVACHGRIVPHAEAVDLIVAASGYLPPDDLTALRASDAHVFSWRKLASVSTTPTVVISSACDSGLNVKNEGGERLGLERPLFVAGTLIYIAPLWPVPTCTIQQVVNELIEQWLEAPQTSLAVHLAELRQRHLAAGTPHLAARALAVFGDAL
jgi:CHAT domain-containing protein